MSNREPLEVTVPRGQVFLMGDNRNNSRDSRSREVGTIETHSIMGKAILRIFPLKSWLLIRKVLKMNKQEVYQFLKDNNIQTEDLIKILKENGNEINIVKI